MTTPNDPDYSQQWGLTQINCPQGWVFQTGSKQGVLIGIVGTGIPLDDKGQLYHQDLSDSEQLILGTNFFDRTLPPNDTLGNSTADTGVISAKTNNDAGIAGVNWATPVYICKVGNSEGSDSDFYDGVVEIVDYAVSKGLKAILYTPYVSLDYSEPLYDACKYVSDHGMIFCCSVGSSGGDIMYPALFSKDFPQAVIAVGSTDQNNNVSNFSGKGSAITVVAPGEDIFTTLLDTAESKNPNPDLYGMFNGTEMSAAFTTGLLSLLWSSNPSLSNADIRQLLIDGATPLSGDNFSNSYGYGLINAAYMYKYDNGASNWGKKRFTTGIAFGLFGGEVVLGVSRNDGGNGRAFIYTAGLSGLNDDYLTIGDEWSEKVGATDIAFGSLGGQEVVGVTRKTSKNNRLQIYKLVEGNLSKCASAGSNWGSNHYATSVAFGQLNGVNMVGVGRYADDNRRFIIYKWDTSSTKEQNLTMAAWGGKSWDDDAYVTDIAFGTDDFTDLVGVARTDKGSNRFFIYQWDSSAEDGSNLTQIAYGGSNWSKKAYATGIAFGRLGGKNVIGVSRYYNDNNRFFIYELDPSSADGLKQIAEGGSGWGSKRYATDIAFGTINGKEVVGITRNDGNNNRFLIYTWDEESDTLNNSPYDGGKNWGSDYGATAIAFGKFDDIDMCAVGRTKGDDSRFQLFQPYYPVVVTQPKTNTDAVYPVPNNVGFINEEGVNLFNGNVNLPVPMGSLSGQNVSYEVTLLYNSASAAMTAPDGNCLNGHGWKLMDYPKIVQDGDEYYFLDGNQSVELVKSNQGYTVEYGDYYLLVFSYDSKSFQWSITTAEGQQYVLDKSDTPIDGYPLWNLSSFTDLSWGDTLLFDYDGNQLKSVSNSTNERLQLNYDSQYLTNVEYYENSTLVSRHVITYTPIDGVDLISNIVTTYLVPQFKTLIQKTPGMTFSYSGGTDSNPYALRSVVTEQGGSVSYDYYAGDGIVYKGTVVRDVHPVISVIDDSKQSSGNGSTVSYGIYYDFVNWDYDKTETLAQFNVVKTYPGGVYATIYDDNPADPYGHVSYYFFNGQPKEALVGVDPRQDDFSIENGNLTGKIYEQGTYSKLLKEVLPDLSNQNSLSTDETVIHLDAPAYNVISFSITISDPSDVSLYFYDQNGNYVTQAELNVQADNTGSCTAVFEFTTTLAVGSVAIYSWSATTTLTNFMLTRVVFPSTNDADMGLPAAESESLVEGYNLTSSVLNLELPTPYNFVTTVTYSAKSDSEGVSEVYFYLKDQNGKVVATLHLNPADYDVEEGTQTFDIPIEVFSVDMVSEDNPAIATDLRFTYLSTGGMAVTDDSLSRQTSAARFLYDTGANGILGLYPQLIEKTDILDYVAQVTEFAYDDATRLPMNSVKEVRNPTLYEGDNLTKTTLKTTFQYAFQHYPDLEELNILLPISQLTQFVDRDGTWEVTASRTTQWEAFDNTHWAPSATYVLNQAVSESELASGYEETPPSQWTKVQSIFNRNSKGLPTVSSNINEVYASRIYDSVYQVVPVAGFFNADASAGQAGYYGFETYEPSSSWEISGGTMTTSDAHTGRQSYEGDTVTVSPSLYSPKPDTSYVISAFVKLNQGGSCTLRFSDTDALVSVDYDESDSGWRYIYCVGVVASDVNKPVIELNKGAVDDVYFGPLDSSLSVTVWDFNRLRATAVIGNNGETQYTDYDLFGEVISKSVSDQQLSSLRVQYNSPYGNFLFSGVSEFTSENPNMALSVMTQNTGLWEPFLYSATANFNAKTLQNMTIGNHMLLVTGTDAKATCETTIIEDDAVITAECYPNAISSGESMGIELTDGADPIQVVLTRGSYALVNKTTDTVLASVTLKNQPKSCTLVVSIMDGSMLSVYADGRFLFNYEASQLSGTVSLVSTNDGAFFYGFGLTQGTVISNTTYDGLGMLRQTLVSDGVDAIQTKEQLYGDTLTLLKAITLPTKSASENSLFGGALTAQTGFVTHFDPDTMTVEGAVTQYWPTAYNTRPFSSSGVQYTSPLLRLESNGFGGDYSAGLAESSEFDYGHNQGLYFGFNPDEMNTDISQESSGLSSLTYKTMEGLIYGSVQSNSSSSYLTGADYNDQLRLSNLYFPNAFTDGKLDENGFFQTFSYDFLGTVHTKQDADGGLTQYKYNKATQLRLYQDPNANTAGTSVYMKYDTLGRLIESGIYSGDFDAVTQENLDTLTWPTTDFTAVNSYTYDSDMLSLENNQGRLTRVQTDLVTVMYAYDNRGNIVHVSRVHDGHTDDVYYSYNQLNLVTGISVTSTRNSVSQLAYEVVYDYDRLGRVIRIGTPENAAFYASYSYENGYVTETLNNGTVPQTIRQNGAGWVESISSEFFSETLYYDTRLNHDAGYYNGQIASIDNEFNWKGAPKSYSYEYVYDAYGRLLSAENSVYGAYSVAVSSYDSNGNICSLTRGSDSFEFSYGTGMNNHLTTFNGTQFGYDDNGNVSDSEHLSISSILYDAVNGLTSQLVKEGVQQQFIYDGNNQLVSTSDGKNTVDYIRGAGLNSLIEVMTDDSESHALGYVYGPSGKLAIVSAETTYFLLKDHQNSTRVVLDSSNQVVSYFNYLPYGTLMSDISSAGDKVDVRYRFTGQEYLDNLQLYRFDTRLYDDSICRFYAIDSAHQFASPYTYSSDPIRFIDWTGNVFTGGGNRVIYMMPDNVDREEFLRQVIEQELGLNSMTYGQIMSAIDTYRSRRRPGCSGRVSSDQRERQFCRISFQAGSGQAVLHNPDAVIGGIELPSGIGDSRINSILGSQNRHWARSIYDYAHTSLLQNGGADMEAHFRFVVVDRQGRIQYGPDDEQTQDLLASVREQRRRKRKQGAEDESNTGSSSKDGDDNGNNGLGEGITTIGVMMLGAYVVSGYI